MTAPPWKVLSETELLKRQYLRVLGQKVELTGGQVIDDFSLIESPPWAAVVCVTQDRKLVLVRQYRHGHQGTSLELPAGIIEEGEDIKTAASRELLEETGYQSNDLEMFWQVRPEPARHRQWAYFAFAPRALKIGDQALDETEHIEVILRPLCEFEQILEEMVHASHVAALLLAARRGLLSGL